MNRLTSPFNAVAAVSAFCSGGPGHIFRRRGTGVFCAEKGR